MLEILYSILLNVFPLCIAAIPMIFLRKKETGKLYSRLYYGLCIFFLIYWVLPSMFQSSLQVLPITVEDQGNVELAFQFLIIRTFSLFVSYLQYPFMILPFIFIGSPFLSMFILWRRIRKEEGTMNKKIEALNYEFNQSPREMIWNNIKSKDWAKEKDLFKAFLILLPISIYLVSVILDIGKIESTDLLNVSEGSTALGWFLEILFVYIATFLIGFQLLKSAKISIGGKFLGEQIQSRFFSSLTEVGTPIAILSVLLFVAQKNESILLIIFFFAYFLMATFIFIMIMAIFEPISILLLIKLISWWKIRSVKLEKKNSPSILTGIVYAGISSLFMIVFAFILAGIQQDMINQVPNGDQFIELSYINQLPTFAIAFLTDILNIVYSLFSIAMILVMAYFFMLTIQQDKYHFIQLLVYSGVLLLITIAISPLFNYNAPLHLSQDNVWQTGTPVIISGLLNFDFITMRTGFLTASVSNNTVLLVLASPFLWLRQISAFALWGFFFFFIKKHFLTKSFVKENKRVERVTFANRPMQLSMNQFRNHPEYYITPNSKNITKSKSYSQDQQSFLSFLKDGQLIQSIIGNIDEKIKDSGEKSAEMKKKQFELILELVKQGDLLCWIPEFQIQYERAELRGLYILYSDGRDLFYFNFKPEKDEVDPGLVSGMFSAISSFIQETTKSNDLLRTIDSGEIKVILEYSKHFPVFAALFADRETSEIRTALRVLLESFQHMHSRVLSNWNGDMSYFEKDKALIDEYFKEFL